MRIRVDHCELYCEATGDGPPVLFVHGFPLSGEMWRPTVQRLSGLRCIVPDLRGHGRSDATPDATISIYADDLAALLDGLGETRPVALVGLSLGGIIAFEFFRRHRRRLRALAIVDARAAAETPEGAARREAMIADVLREGSRAAAAAMIDNLFAAGVDPALRQTWHDVMAGTPPVGVVAAIRAIRDRPDALPLLAKIDCPALVVVGEHDAITPPEMLREIHAAIPGARFELIRGAGHMPPVEQPDRFAQVLAGFLAELPA